MFKAIVVGTDGSNTATTAVHQAAELARTHGAQLHIVSAYRVPTMSLASASIEGAALAAAVPEPSEQHDDAAEIVKDAAAKVHSGLNVRTYVCHGDPADAIISVAEQENADLIVVGSRGMTGAMRFLLGSVPNKVSHHAPCSVLIVRTC